MTDENPYRIGDPVVDLAQGRPMVVLDAPDETVREWSDRENYDLADNYANGKLGTTDDEHVVRCVYVSDIRSEPSKDYTFPVSRVALIDAHHADDGRRLYDRVVRDTLVELFLTAANFEKGPSTAELFTLCQYSGIDDDLLTLANELADVEQTVAADDSPDPSSGGGFET